MLFVSYMIRQAMPASVNITDALCHADFVRIALSKSPIHVRIAIIILTFAYVPISMVGIGSFARKYIPLFNLLIRAYRSLIFLQLFGQE